MQLITAVGRTRLAFAPVRPGALSSGTGAGKYYAGQRSSGAYLLARPGPAPGALSSETDKVGGQPSPASPDNLRCRSASPRARLQINPPALHVVAPFEAPSLVVWRTKNRYHRQLVT
jgi:hypothetical protein